MKKVDGESQSHPFDSSPSDSENVNVPARDFAVFSGRDSLGTFAALGVSWSSEKHNSESSPHPSFPGLAGNDKLRSVAAGDIIVS